VISRLRDNILILSKYTMFSVCIYESVIKSVINISEHDNEYEKSRYNNR